MIFNTDSCDKIIHQLYEESIFGKQEIGNEKDFSALYKKVIPYICSDLALNEMVLSNKTFSHHDTKLFTYPDKKPDYTKNAEYDEYEKKLTIFRRLGIYLLLIGLKLGRI